MLDQTRSIPSRRSTSTRDVIEKLIAPHHEYLRHAMPFLLRVATKVARLHGDIEPSLLDLARRFEVLVATLDAHMDEEEGELFPALIEGRVHEALPMLLAMRREHEELDHMLDELRRAACDYRPPGWASHCYRVLMYELRSLEKDVREHLRIENHVLLPRFVS